MRADIVEVPVRAEVAHRDGQLRSTPTFPRQMGTAGGSTGGRWPAVPTVVLTHPAPGMLPAVHELTITGPSSP